jgi:chitinase
MRRTAKLALALLLTATGALVAARPAMAATVPGAPTALEVTVGHFGLAELHWVAPSDGGAPIESYLIRTSPSDPGTAYPGDIPAAQHEVQYGTTYQFAVAAVNALGTGPWSNEVSVTPMPMLSVAPASVVEGNAGTSSLNFDVSLDDFTMQTVTVFYFTGNGTAKAGSDYLAQSGMLTFAPGVEQQTISVPVNGDLSYERTEKMKVVLTFPTNAVFRHRRANGTITNDDAVPTVGVADVAAAEGTRPGSTAFHLTVAVSQPSGLPVKALWSTMNGTAVAPADYTARFATLAIPAGRTSATLVVNVRADALPEGDEQFVVNLFSPAGAAIGDGQAAVTVVDDD